MYLSHGVFFSVHAERFGCVVVVHSAVVCAHEKWGIVGMVHPFGFGFESPPTGGVGSGP